MCLIAFAWRTHPDWPLILAANRDEFHARPSLALAWWSDLPDIAGGRDLEAGGTWLAVSRAGRFATVTNYREDLTVQKGELSRGTLVTAFLASRDSPLEFTERLDGRRYAGVSLLTGTRDAIAYVSNRGDPARELPPGVYGLSNASLDTPWSKVARSKAALQALVADDDPDVSRLFDLLADRSPANAEALPGLSTDTARAVSAPFVVTPAFGTRCSTVLLAAASGHTQLHERRFDAAGHLTGESSIEFDARESGGDLSR